MIANEVDALLVVSFGGPESAGDVMPFLERVTSGRGVPASRLKAVAAQYAELGGVSPLNRENRNLVSQLRSLAPAHWRGNLVYLGNRNSEPFLTGTLAEMADHSIRRAGVFITSAFSSYSGCRQYREDLASGLQSSGAPVGLTVLPRFHDHELLSDIWAEQIRDVWPGVESRLVFVTHSIPVAGSDKYVSQHLDLARSVVNKLNHSGVHPRWEFAYQSRSGSPAQPWLEPDIGDVIRSMADRSESGESGSPDWVRSVVVAPIGFCSENVEILWDLDRMAMGIAAESNLDYVRTCLPQSDPRFVEMIANLWSAPRGRTCATDCCPNPNGLKPAVGDSDIKRV